MKAKILIPLLLLLLMGKGYAQAGDGKSKSNPLSVAQAIDKKADKEYYWVKGYIVGYINKSLANTVFGVGATKTNVILADDSTCTDKSKILPVEPRHEGRFEACVWARRYGRVERRGVGDRGDGNHHGRWHASGGEETDFE